MGETFSGSITSDRCPAYNWVDVHRRQLCWAHLKRDFIQISERVGASAQIGKSLLEQEKELFNLWHKFRNDQLTRSELKERVEPIKTKVLSILLEASQLDINEREKTPLAKTVRTCRNLLKLEVALWLFISSDGVLEFRLSRSKSAIASEIGKRPYKNGNGRWRSGMRLNHQIGTSGR